MEVLGFSLALIGFLLCAVIWLRSMRQSQDADTALEALQSQLVSARAESKGFKEKAQKGVTRIQVLEKELAEAVARRDEKAMAAVMWELELERSYRQWSDVILPGQDQIDFSIANVGQRLTLAIAHEVDRLRDEVGVSIRFEGLADINLEPETALGLLRICEELLALSAKQADEVDVKLDLGSEPSVSVVVVCVGWESAENPQDSELGQMLKQMAQKLDGWIKWDKSGDDSLTISLSVPASIAEVVVDMTETETPSDTQTETQSETQSETPEKEHIQPV